jgi:putative transposase
VKSGRTLSVLAPLDDDKGNSKPRLDAAVIDIVDRCIREHWLTNERLPMSIAIEAIERSVMRHNDETGADLPVPSGTSVRRHVAVTYPEFETVARREGRAAAEQKFRHVRKAPEPQRPLEVVEIDHTKLDAFVVIDGPKGPETRRPWITVAICAATRMMVGYHISLDAPSWTAIMAALSMGVRPKTALLASDPDLKSPWPVYGVPEMAKTDNGLEFHSNSLKAAAGHLGFEIQYTPRRKPFLKGRIERFYGEIARNMATMPGRTFRDVRERGDYRSQEKARMTIEGLHALFLVWVVDYYHNRPHAGLLGRTPLDVWQEKAAAFDVRLPPSVDELDALCGLVIDRTVTNIGVQHLGLDYQSAELQAMRRARSHMGKLWRVKVDPSDLSTVLVYDEDGRKWLRVPSTDPALTDGLTLSIWKEIVEAARAATKAKQQVSRRTLLEARERLLAMAGRGTRSSPPKMKASDLDWARDLDERSFADVSDLAREKGDDAKKRRRTSRRSEPQDSAPVSAGNPAMEVKPKATRPATDDRQTGEPRGGAALADRKDQVDPEDPSGWS